MLLLPGPLSSLPEETGRQDPRQARPLQRLLWSLFADMVHPCGDPSEWTLLLWLRGERGSEMALPIL